MKGRIGKISLLMVALLVAVGAMGAGFASWTDTLTIDGTVTTADFKVGILDISALVLNSDYDPGPNCWEDGGALLPTTASPQDGTADPQFGPGTNEEGKNVASTNSFNIGDSRFVKDVFYGDAVLEDLPFYGTVREEIHNAYPWYASGAEIAIANAGDIPVHIVDVDFNQTGGDCGVLAWLVLHSWEAWVHTATGQELVTSGSGIADLEKLLSGYDPVEPGRPFQLEPCETLRLVLKWHFEQDIMIDNEEVVMPQNADCEFTIDIDVQQWAE